MTQDKVNPFKEISRGIEKEALRINSAAEIALTAHPISLGKALTHPLITTDFSESLLEFVTPVSSKSETVLMQLEDIQNHVLLNIKDELILPASMPTILPEDEKIPLARYGDSNNGLLKTVYRRGLGHRYGRSMQTIAGIHYNFSLSDHYFEELYKVSSQNQSLKDFKTGKYFDLIRNFLRYEWLLIYLFGACPVLDKSFLKNKKHHLKKLNKNTFYKPYATSLRMSDLGYTSNAQASLHICYNSMENYLSTLSKALTFPYPAYQEIKNQKEDQFEQLNPNLLQIENEFYSTIRPKRVVNPDERPLNALNERGVEYIEVRLLDINPYLELGIDNTQIDFLDAFLIFCLESPSLLMTDIECLNLKENKKNMVENGRFPNLNLIKENKEINFKDYAFEVLEKMKKITRGFGEEKHLTSISLQEEKINDISLTPSQKMIDELSQKNIDYTEFILQKAHELKKKALDKNPDEAIKQHFLSRQKKSIQDQSHLEEKEESQIIFKDFLEQYNHETPQIIPH